MKTRSIESHQAKRRGKQLAGWVVQWFLICLWISSFSTLAQIRPAHATTPTHPTLMEYAIAKAGELPTPLTFPSTASTKMIEGSSDEDALGPTCVLWPARAIQHGWNVLVDTAFVNPCPSVVATMTAHDASADRWNGMVTAFTSGNFNGGDEVGAWHFLGRTSHLLQDMTSPMHVFAIDHAGIAYVSEACQFESFWQTNDASLRSVLSTIGGPLHSSNLDAKATEKLDAFTAQRLAYRFEHSCPNKTSEDVRGWLEVLAWITYFRATIWGEVFFGSSGSSGAATTASTTARTFTDGYVGSKPNTLRTMFDGEIRWIAGFLDNYYEITDRTGRIYRFMSWSDIDDWAACGPSPNHGGWAYGQQDGSIRGGGTDDDDRGVRLTGRFWFDTRELGKSTTGGYNRFCFPHHYPDGTAMTNQLHRYFGETLNPLAVRYNAGLLGLANRRVTVRTADPTQANNFTLGRKDNFGNGPSFNAGSTGQMFYFAAKSSVTLTAPEKNNDGRTFVRWLRDGSEFTGNASKIITINDITLPVPAGGVTYTAEYEPCSYVLDPTIANHNYLAGAGGFNVTAPTGCTWSATTVFDWIHTISSGSGPGMVYYSIDNNPGGSRVGYIMVDEQVFTVEQSGPSTAALGWSMSGCDLWGSSVYPFNTVPVLPNVPFTCSWNSPSNYTTVLTADVNGDGLLEMVMGGSTDIRVYSASGTLLGSLAEGTTLNLLADVDHDKKAEILASDRMTGDIVRIRAFKLNGTVVQTWTKAGKSDSVMQANAVVDLDLDGDLELVATTQSGYSQGIRGMVVFEVQTGAEVRYWDIGPSVQGLPAIGNITSDAKLEIVHGSGGPANGKTGADGSVDDASYAWALSLNTGIVWRQGPFNCDGFYDSAVRLGDLDQDGHLDIVVSPFGHAGMEVGRLLLLNRDTGNVIAGFDRDFGNTGLKVCGIADLRPGGRKEVLAVAWSRGETNFRLLALDSNAGFSDWREFNAGNSYLNVCALNDLDGDRWLEVVVCYGNTLAVLDNELRVQWQWQRPDNSALPVSSAIVCDLDNDSVNEILVVSGNSATTSRVEVLKYPRAVPFALCRPSAQSADGMFHLSLTGLSGQRPSVIEVSTNLHDWMGIFTNTAPVRWLEYVEPMTNQQTRFYRAVEP